MTATRFNRRDQWKKHVEAFHASGVRQSEYCRKAGIRAESLRYWRLRFRDEVDLRKQRAEQLVPVDVVAKTSSRISAALQLAVENAGTVEIRGDLGAIVELLSSLRDGGLR